MLYNTTHEIRILSRIGCPGTITGSGTRFLHVPHLLAHLVHINTSASLFYACTKINGFSEMT